jgi:hypothetical protein
MIASYHTLQPPCLTNSNQRRQLKFLQAGKQLNIQSLRIRLAHMLISSPTHAIANPTFPLQTEKPSQRSAECTSSFHYVFHVVISPFSLAPALPLCPHRWPSWFLRSVPNTASSSRFSSNLDGSPTELR